jgi:hypothetical protein
LSQSQQLRVRKGVKRKLDEEEEEEECNLSLHHCWQIIYQTYIKHLIINGGYDGTSLQVRINFVEYEIMMKNIKCNSHEIIILPMIKNSY